MLPETPLIEVPTTGHEPEQRGRSALGVGVAQVLAKAWSHTSRSAGTRGAASTALLLFLPALNKQVTRAQLITCLDGNQHQENPEALLQSDLEAEIQVAQRREAAVRGQ